MNRRLLASVGALALVVAVVAVVFLTTSGGGSSSTTLVDSVLHQQRRTAATGDAVDGLNVFRAAGAGLGAAVGLFAGAVAAYSRREDL
jgi:hypothetical protein